MELGIELPSEGVPMKEVVSFVRVSSNWETPLVTVPLSWAIQKVSGDIFPVGSSLEDLGRPFSHTSISQVL